MCASKQRVTLILLSLCCIINSILYIMRERKITALIHLWNPKNGQGTMSSRDLRVLHKAYTQGHI